MEITNFFFFHISILAVRGRSRGVVADKNPKEVISAKLKLIAERPPVKFFDGAANEILKKAGFRTLPIFDRTFVWTEQTPQFETPRLSCGNTSFTFGPPNGSGPKIAE